MDQNLNINPDTLNHVEEKVGNNHEHTGTEGNFLNRTSRTLAVRLTVNKWDLMKLKISCKAKDTITRTEQQPT